MERERVIQSFGEEEGKLKWSRLPSKRIEKVEEFNQEEEAAVQLPA